MMPKFIVTHAPICQVSLPNLAPTQDETKKTKNIKEKIMKKKITMKKLCKKWHKMKQKSKNE